MARVDFIANPSDMDVLALGSLGYSTSYIARVTGFTSGQIQYRLSQGDVKRSEYRDGNSTVAQMVFSSMKRNIVVGLKRNFK